MRLIYLSILAMAVWAEVPSGMAIRNARVVTVSGAVLPKATVLIRDGLIEAVGQPGKPKRVTCSCVYPQELWAELSGKSLNGNI